MAGCLVRGCVLERRCKAHRLWPIFYALENDLSAAAAAGDRHKRRRVCRGDFVIFIMSGVFFIYDPYRRDLGSRHSRGPCVADDAACSDEYGDRGCLGRVGFFYMQLLSIIVILGFYYFAFTPFVIEEPLGTFMMFVLAWFSGCAIGLVIYALKP